MSQLWIIENAQGRCIAAGLGDVARRAALERFKAEAAACTIFGAAKATPQVRADERRLQSAKLRLLSRKQAA